LSGSLFLAILSSIISDAMLKGHLLVFGDMNSHFGYDEEEVASSPFFGKFLHHAKSNNNGDEILMLCELHKLNVLTTIRHKSTLVTWTNLRLS
jgi:hypothetical protein